jgi:hypothetical protein
LAFDASLDPFYKVLPPIHCFSGDWLPLYLPSVAFTAQPSEFDPNHLGGFPLGDQRLDLLRLFRHDLLA